MKNEVIHYLEILVELQLFPILKVMTETTQVKIDIDTQHQKQIIKFINELPDDYKNIPNRDEIIANKLKIMGIKTLWVEKKIEENEMKKNIENNRVTKYMKKENSDIEK